MHEFKQWHDDDLKFHQETKLSFSQCNCEKNLKVSQLLALTSDAGVEDYFQRGLSWQFLAEHGFGILLSRTAFRVHRMPKVHDYLTISTWEEKPQGLQLRRCYELTAPGGEKLVSGLSTWIVVNFETRRIVKPGTFTLRPEPQLFTEMDCPYCGKIALPEGMQLLEERTVRFSDLDGNGHMNNARYGDYIADCLPQSFRDKPFKEFCINYSQEAVLGQNLSIYGLCQNDGTRLVISAKQTQGTCFEAVVVRGND